MMVEVEEPVAKLRSALKSTAGHHSSQDQVVEGEGTKGPLSGMPAKVQQGRRQCKAVKFDNSHVYAIFLINWYLGL